MTLHVAYKLKVLKDREDLPENCHLLEDIVKPEYIKNGEVKLTPHCKIVLRHLLDISPAPINKDRLVTFVWPDTDQSPLCAEVSLSIYIWKIRQALKPKFHIINIGNSRYGLFYVEKRIDKKRLPAIKKRRSPTAASLAERQFDQKVIPSKKKYNRRSDRLEDYLKGVLHD